ncbi:MAG: dephospho-CoA kinase [Oscillospiraceae bacterium]|nr:dephospho-CoA kinase [Oscillospiraceae bacterium]
MINFNELNIIGLTGMSGSGKTSASKIFAENGFCVIDCDKQARRVISQPPCADAVRCVFPEGYSDNGEFDRIKMAGLVFSDREKLARYEKIVFPYVIYDINFYILNQAQNGGRNFLLDAPTLYQSGADDLCSKILAVVSDMEICVRRIIKRDGIHRESAVMRLNAQPSVDFYKEKADFIISNDGDEESFLKRIFEIIETLKVGRGIHARY